MDRVCETDNFMKIKIFDSNIEFLFSFRKFNEICCCFKNLFHSLKKLLYFGWKLIFKKSQKYFEMFNVVKNIFKFMLKRSCFEFHIK